MTKSEYSIIIGNYMQLFEDKGKLTPKIENKLYDWFENFNN